LQEGLQPLLIDLRDDVTLRDNMTGLVTKVNLNRGVLEDDNQVPILHPHPYWLGVHEGTLAWSCFDNPCQAGPALGDHLVREGNPTLALLLRFEKLDDNVVT